jgi:multiple sugar transport system permease protein
MKPSTPTESALPHPNERLPPLFPQRASRRFRGREALAAALFLLPAGLVLVTFQFLPIFYAFYISLHRWGLIREAFVGLENYRDLLHDAEFWRSLVNTLWFVLGTVPLGIGISLGLALLLFGELKARGFFRTLYFLPYITSTVAAALAWSWIYNANYGVLNFFLNKLGITSLKWLVEPTGIFKMMLGRAGDHLPAWAQGPSLTLAAIIVMTIWNTLGFNLIVYMAGLGAVSKEFQEAARIDGASEWKVFRHVTWPLLTPTTFFLLIINTIRSFQAFNQIYVMPSPNPGGPLGTTQVVTVYVFKTFYSQTRMGYGSAVAFALFLIILALTLVQFRLAREKITYG